jgi:hypothetical protein
MVQQFDAGDLDDAVARSMIESGGLCIEYDLAHQARVYVSRKRERKRYPTQIMIDRATKTMPSTAKMMAAT